MARAALFHLVRSHTTRHVNPRSFNLLQSENPKMAGALFRLARSQTARHIKPTGFSLHSVMNKSSLIEHQIGSEIPKMTRMGLLHLVQSQTGPHIKPASFNLQSGYRHYIPGGTHLQSPCAETNLKSLAAAAQRRLSTQAAAAEEGSKISNEKNEPPMSPKIMVRPLSSHLPVYAPQISSTTSIFNRISGCYLTAVVLSYYLLCVQWSSIFLTNNYFYQLLFHSSKLVLISTELTVIAMVYHIVISLLHLKGRLNFGGRR